MRLELRLALECTVCLRKLGEDKDTATEAALFGAKSYAVCCGCFQRTPIAMLHDADFRARYRVMMFEKFGRVMREP